MLVAVAGEELVELLAKCMSCPENSLQTDAVCAGPVVVSPKSLVMVLIGFGQHV